MAKPQDALDNIWGKYRKSLNDLNTALDENEALRADADIDFSMPDDILALEQAVEEKLAKHGIA
jgi:hypothetical protein